MKTEKLFHNVFRILTVPILGFGLLSNAEETKSKEVMELKNPFEGIIIGSVVNEDGTLNGATDVFDLKQYMHYVKTDEAPDGNIDLEGQSNYYSSDSMHSVAVRGSGEFGTPVKAITGEIGGSWGISKANSKMVVSVSCINIGQAAIATTSWQNLSPNLLASCLKPSLTIDPVSGRGPFMRLLDKYKDVKEQLENKKTIDAETANAFISEYKNFKKNYGIGFVSGVIIGGMGGVTLSVDRNTLSEAQQWSANGTFGGNIKGVGGSLGVAYGGQKDTASSDAKVSVSAFFIGGKVYSDFATKYYDIFAGKALDKLWDTQVTQGPNIKDEMANIKLNIPKTKPVAPSSILDLPFPIKDPTVLEQYREELAFNAWKKQQNFPNADIDAFRLWKQTHGPVFALDNISAAQTAVQINSVPAPDGTPNILQNTGSGNNTSAPILKAQGAKISPKKDALSNNNSELWNSYLKGNVVVGVLITKWEDVFPQFIEISRFIELSEQIEQFKCALYKRSLISIYENIEAMYDIASTASYTEKDKTLFNGIASQFNTASDALYKLLVVEASKDLTREQIAKIYDKWKLKQAPNLQKIVDAYTNNPSIFNQGSMGYVGYYTANELSTAWILKKLSPTYPAKIESAPWTAIYVSNANTKDIKNLSDPTIYKDALKLFPILDPIYTNNVKLAVFGTYKDANGKLKSNASFLSGLGFGSSWDEGSFITIVRSKKDPSKYAGFNIIKVSRFNSDIQKEVLTCNLMPKLDTISLSVNWGSYILERNQSGVGMIHMKDIIETKILNLFEEAVTPGIYKNDPHYIRNPDATYVHNDGLYINPVDMYYFYKDIAASYAPRKEVSITDLKGVKLTLIPFNEKEIESVRDWKGFRALTFMSDDLYIARVFSQLTEYYKVQEGKTYWTDKTPNLDRTYDPADMITVSWCKSLIKPPAFWVKNK